MSIHLRKAVEKARQHYIKQLAEAGMFTAKDEETERLTLTELERIAKQLDSIKR